MGLERLLQHGHQPSHADSRGRLIGSARAYEFFGALFFGGLRGRAYDRLAALSGARPGDRVLDVGCGTGLLTRRMARTVAPDGSAVGVDPSPSVLAYARDHTTEANCSYEEGVGQELGLPDASVDVVVSCLALHHVPEDQRQAAVREMHRVLRPGGRLMLADFRPPRTRAARRLVAGLTAHTMAYYRVELPETLVADAGFRLRGRGDVRPWLRYVRAERPGDSPPGTSVEL
ncbi:methyltransferase domain-containing protein [Streptomyces sp. NPDC059002]|uniref:methyltransferase domain-containing protein n=1 Tax=Streptomyces sp. NPDC059002 TaxID=3346690 RepID=UPI0036945710